MKAKSTPSASSTPSGGVDGFKPKRGRPTADQAEAINDAILTAASQSFQAKGFDATTMGAIAEVVGVSKATLYSRFPDKLALLRAVMEERLSAWGAISSQRAVPQGSSLETRLKKYAMTLLMRASSEEFRAFKRLASGSWNEAAEVVSSVRDAGQEHYLQILIREIEAAGEADGMPPRNARRVAISFMGIISGLLASEVGEAAVDEEEAAPLADFVVGLLLHGRAGW